VKIAPAPLDEELAKRIRETESPATLASICSRTWPKIYFGAVPYLQAMRTMSSFKEDYGADDGKEIAIYFLANAGTWKGDVAKAVKARIKELVGVK
jgi:hypothetical protein